MVKDKVKVNNSLGLHLRPAGILCKMAMRYQSSVYFQFRDTKANAKSVLSVLGACVKQGDEIELICDGIDEEKALRDLIQLIETGLDE